MFDTPKEAVLKAENARLRAENEYLRRAVEAPDVRVTPYAVEQDMEFSGSLPPQITLPCSASVRGRLMEDQRWHVVGRAGMRDGSRVEVSYYMPRFGGLPDAELLNSVLPRMHEQFIRHLADLFSKIAPEAVR